MQLIPGTVVDRYTVMSTIGRGGMATVYAVKHNLLGTRHALKVLKQNSAETKARLMLEGRLQARLDPTHIVPVTDVLDVDGSPALLMPLIDGCALDQLLSDAQPSEAEVSAIFGAIAKGIASAHKVGVIHRDLKPANVLLEERHGRIRVRVADFGLARVGEGSIVSKSAHVFGTPAYASPEQLTDSDAVSERTDLWSLGVILYEMLTGERPFAADSTAAVMFKILEGEFSLNAVPEHWRELVAGLLQVDLADRGPPAEELHILASRCCSPRQLVIGTPVAEAVRQRTTSRPSLSSMFLTAMPRSASRTGASITRSPLSDVPSPATPSANPESRFYTGVGPPPRRFQAGDVIVDLDSYSAGGEDLSDQEVGLLEQLVAAAGSPVSREELYREVWGYRKPPKGRALDFAVRRLRQKLEPSDGATKTIHTVRGVGFKLEVIPLVDEPLALSTASRPGNLPNSPDPFIGREDALAKLKIMTDEGACVISILGIGGSGKTRLAKMFARNNRDDWPGGIWFCDLADTSSLDSALGVMARVFGFNLQDEDPVSQVGRAIKHEGECLVILDNFEQLARYARKLITSWGNIASKATFLLTTREVLGVRGERTLPLPPMTLDDAVGLFELRAAEVSPGFAINDQAMRSDVESLVELLDRLPLAVELAAARTRVLPPSKLLQRMSDRFKLLISRTGRGDRQSTMRATLDWSWNLLNDWEKSALSQVSQFEGGFDLEAAEEILDLSNLEGAPWPMDAIQSLVDKSLIRAAGEDYFILLNSVKDYASERAAEDADLDGLKDRHAAYFATIGAPEALEGIYSRDGEWRRQRLEAQLDNLIAACRWSILQGNSVEALHCLAGAFVTLAATGPVQVAAELALSVVAMPSLEGSALIRAQLLAGKATKANGDLAQALTFFETAHASPALAESSELRIETGHALGMARWYTKGANTGTSVMEEALELAKRLGKRRLEGEICNSLGLVYRRVGRHDEGEALFDRAIRIQTTLKNDRALARAMINLASFYWKAARIREADAMYLRAIHILQELNEPMLEASAYTNLGIIKREMGSPSDAEACYERAVDLHQQTGNHQAELRALGNMAILFHDREEYGRAAERYGEVIAGHEANGQRKSAGLMLVNRGDLYVTVGKLNDAQSDYVRALAHLEDFYADGAAIARASLGFTQALRGELEAGYQTINEAISQLEQLDFPVELAKARCKQAHLLQLLDDLDGASEALSQAERLKNDSESNDPQLIRLLKTTKELLAN